MPTFQQLPWELRHKILRYIAADEIVNAKTITEYICTGEHYLHPEFMTRMTDGHINDFYARGNHLRAAAASGGMSIGQKVVKLELVYSEILVTLMNNKELRKELQPLVYTYTILDLTTINPFMLAHYHEFLQPRLHRFERIFLPLSIPHMKRIGDLFDRVRQLTFLDMHACGDITKMPFPEASLAVKVARATKKMFRLFQGATVELKRRERPYESSENRSDLPFEIETNMELDKKATAWADKYQVLSADIWFPVMT